MAPPPCPPKQFNFARHRPLPTPSDPSDPCPTLNSDDYYLVEPAIDTVRRVKLYNDRCASLFVFIGWLCSFVCVVGDLLVF